MYQINENSRHNDIKKASVILAVLFFLILLSYFTITFVENSDEQLPQNQVVKLDSTQMGARFRFGRSDMCLSSSVHKECWVDQDYVDKDWLAIDGTEFDIRRLPEFDIAVSKRSFAYYRLWLEVPEDLARLATPISFLAGFIHHKSYEVFVNGRLVLDSTPKRPQMLSISLPDLALKKPILIVIKANLDISDLGIWNDGRSWYVGNKYVIDKLAKNDSWPVELFSFCSLASVFVIFSLLVLMANTRPNMYTFLLFLFCTAVDCLLRTDVFAAILDYNITVMIYVLVRVLKTAAFLAFVLREFFVPINARSFYLASAFLIAAGAMAAFDYGWGSHTITLRGISLGCDILFITACIVGIVCGVRYEYLRSAKRAVLACGIIALMLSYILTHLAKIIFVSDSLYAIVQICDLMFVFMLGFLSANSYRIAAEKLAKREREVADEKIDYVLAKAARLLAHDVRAPFFSLIMNLDYIESTSHEDAAGISVKGLLPRIRAQLRSVDDTINNILAIGKDCSDTEGVASTHDCLELALFEIFSVRQSADISFDITIPQKHLLRIDAVSLQRVLSNIIVNAVEAMHQSGKIQIRGYEEIIHDVLYAHVIIKNTGSFIPKELLEKIFEVDFTVGKKHGTGLGLAICRGLIERAGGRIWCESDRKTGTEFHFTLKVASFNKVYVEKSWPRTVSDLLKYSKFSPSTIEV